MASTIVTKNSSTASAVPVTGDLTQGELAVNVTDKRLFTKNSGGTVVELGTNPASLALPNGTTNGVAYLNGSKVVTTGSALTFDGTSLGLGRAAAFGVGAGIEIYRSGPATLRLNNASVGAENAFEIQTPNSGPVQFTSYNSRDFAWSTTGSEQMRLTSTGLGIGTSSPAYKLQVAGVISSNDTVRVSDGTTTTIMSIAGTGEGTVGTSSNHSLQLRTNNTTKATLDSSGNLGLGVTPSAWSSGRKAFQISGGAIYTGDSSTDNIGIIQNGFNDGTGWKRVAAGYASRYYQNNSGHYFDIAGTSTAGSAITFTQAMTLDASGNLFVGATSAAAGKMVVKDTSSSNTLWLVGRTSDGASSVSFRNAADSAYNARLEAVSGYLAIETNGSERARIDSSGNLLVGTTPSTASALSGGRLVSTSDGTNFAGTFYQSSTSSSVYTMRVRHDNTTSGAYIQFVTDNNVETGRIYDSAGTMQYASSSDARLKTNVQPIQNGLSSVLALNPCTFDMRRGENTFIPSAGLIAQEVHEVYPFAVGVGGDDENTNPWSVDYGKLTPLLIKAIQEQQAIIEQLKADVAALKGN